MFKNIPAADFSAFTAPVQKILDLNTATVAKAFQLQQAAAQKQMAQSQASVKAALAIKDAEGFTTFITEQSEVAKANLETLKTDVQVALESTKAYFAEVQAILTESQEAVAKAVKKAA